MPGLAPVRRAPNVKVLRHGEHIGLLARLFGGMAHLIDQIYQDRRSPTRSEAIVNAAGSAAARASAEAWWAGGYEPWTSRAR